MPENPVHDFVQEHLQALKNGLDTMLSDRKALDERITVRRQLIESLEAEDTYGSPLFQSSPAEITATNGSGPNKTAEMVDRLVASGKTGQACRQVVNESSVPLTGSEVFDELGRRGWVPRGIKDPRAAVGSALWYQAKNGHILALGDDQNRRWARIDFAPPESDAKTANPETLLGGVTS